MPTVRFVGMRSETTARDGETLLDAARAANVTIGNSCGGVGVCARCRVRVVEGAQNLSTPTSIEQRVGGARDFTAEERLACQATVRGDCAITTSYW